MIEGSQIDWACHANDRNWLRAEQLDFEATVRAAFEFAASDGQTLVIVTGDHECGGLSLPQEPGNRRGFKATFFGTFAHGHPRACVRLRTKSGIVFGYL